MRLRYARVDHSLVRDEDSGEDVEWDSARDEPQDPLGEFGVRWELLGRPKPAPYEDGPENS